MKKLLFMLVLVVAAMLNSRMAYSAEKGAGVPDSYDQYKSYELNGQKDQCLVEAKNCTGGADTVLKRVERINREIGKGSAVYTPEELQNFQEQLNWIYYESGEFPAVRM